MKTLHPSFARLAAAWLLTAACSVAHAQASAPAALPDLPPGASSAPAAPASKPTGPRLRTPAEIGNRATAPGDLRPERPVAPQITIPFGKTSSPPAKNEARVVPRGSPAQTGGGIDDSAARCEAQADEPLRAACRAKLARESKGKSPN